MATFALPAGGSAVMAAVDGVRRADRGRAAQRRSPIYGGGGGRQRCLAMVGCAFHLPPH